MSSPVRCPVIAAVTQRLFLSVDSVAAHWLHSALDMSYPLLTQFLMLLPLCDLWIPFLLQTVDSFSVSASYSLSP